MHVTTQWGGSLDAVRAGKPEDYYKRARSSIVSARGTWLELMAMLGLKP